MHMAWLDNIMAFQDVVESHSWKTAPKAKPMGEFADLALLVAEQARPYQTILTIQS